MLIGTVFAAVGLVAYTVGTTGLLAAHPRQRVRMWRPIPQGPIRYTATMIVGAILGTVGIVILWMRVGILVRLAVGGG